MVTRPLNEVRIGDRGIMFTYKNLLLTEVVLTNMKCKCAEQDLRFSLPKSAPESHNGSDVTSCAVRRC